MVLYLIRNRQTGREYVGTTVRTLQRRWADHISACFTKQERSPLYADMREMGLKAFEISAIDEVADYDTLMAREQAEIAGRGTLFPSGYNRVRGGRGNFGWIPSAETRANMSHGQRGRVTSDETKAKLSAALKGRPQVHPRRNRAAWNKGVPHSDVTRAKLSATRAGKPWSEARRRAGGPKHGQDVKNLLSEQKRAWWASLTAEAKTAHIDKMKFGQRKG